jgi:nitroreductase
MSLSFDTRNKVFDELIANRRSVRAFTDETPPREQVSAICAAGLAAPFAAVAVGDVADFRRFIVFRKGSEALKTVVSLLAERAQDQLETLRNREPGAPFLERLQVVAEGRIPALGTAPYIIAVAEQKGIPPVEQHSLAHCLENMWLKATALDLGFQLVSAIAMLTDEPRFWELCGLPYGRYGVNGCAVGVPAAVPPPRLRPALDEVMTWMG